jgi:hypothetical protein
MEGIKLMSFEKANQWLTSHTSQGAAPDSSKRG